MQMALHNYAIVVLRLWILVEVLFLLFGLGSGEFLYNGTISSYEKRSTDIPINMAEVINLSRQASHSEEMLLMCADKGIIEVSTVYRCDQFLYIENVQPAVVRVYVIPSDLTNIYVIYFLPPDRNITSISEFISHTRYYGNKASTFTYATIKGLASNRVYIFCLVNNRQGITSFFKCRSHLIEDIFFTRPWLFMEYRPYIAALFSFGFLLVFAAGWRTYFWAARWYTLSFNVTERNIFMSTEVLERQHL